MVACTVYLIFILFRLFFFAYVFRSLCFVGAVLCVYDILGFAFDLDNYRYYGVDFFIILWYSSFHFWYHYSPLHYDYLRPLLSPLCWVSSNLLIGRLWVHALAVLSSSYCSVWGSIQDRGITPCGFIRFHCDFELLWFRRSQIACRTYLCCRLCGGYLV